MYLIQVNLKLPKSISVVVKILQNLTYNVLLFIKGLTFFIKKYTYIVLELYLSY